ncbi:MAG: hypothetical protein ISS41_11860 [Candidatus Aminicenantes bacterium]|nr:hypothetical protein [Candidatus Aminicenantes bacterium]
MNLKRVIVLFSLPILLSSFLLSQSVAELAKKEKERREKLKEKKTTVITNADLKKVKKKSGVSVRQPAFYEPPSKKESTAPKTSSIDQADPSEIRAMDQKEPREETPEELEAKWNKSKEYVELLTTKLNGLWHEFYNMNSMKSKETIQQQIAETSKKLEKARADEVTTKRDFERSGKRAKKK